MRGRDSCCWTWGNRGTACLCLCPGVQLANRGGSEPGSSRVPGTPWVFYIGKISVLLALIYLLLSDILHARFPFKSAAETVRWSVCTARGGNPPKSSLSPYLLWVRLETPFRDTEVRGTQTLRGEHTEIFQISFAEVAANHPGLPVTERCMTFHFKTRKILASLGWVGQLFQRKSK